MVQCSENMCFLRLNFLPLFSFLLLPSILWTHRSEQWLPLARGRKKKTNRKYLCDCLWQFPGIHFTSTNSDFFLGIHHATKVLISPLFAHPKQKSVLWGPVIFISVIVESPFSLYEAEKSPMGACNYTDNKNILSIAIHHVFFHHQTVNPQYWVIMNCQSPSSRLFDITSKTCSQRWMTHLCFRGMSLKFLHTP